MTSLFSAPQPTVAAAVALHVDELFNPAAVWKTEEGFVYARLHTMEGREPTAGVSSLPGYTLAATCDALLGVWRLEPAATESGEERQ